MAELNYWQQLSLRRLPRRRMLQTGTASGLSLLLAACSGGHSSPHTVQPNSAPSTGTPLTTDQPKRGGTLRWALEDDLDTLDPVFTDRAVTWELADHFYDSLFTYDASEHSQPVLIKDYSLSTDSLTYTFRLRTDATFAGGHPITSADVIASLQRWGQKATSGLALFSALNSLEAKDDYTFVLETKTPYGLAIEALTVGAGTGPYIMTKDAATTPPDQRVDTVVASGPFNVTEWTKGSRIVLTPRTDYKGPLGPSSDAAGTRNIYLASIEVPIIPDQNSRLTALQAGTIDFFAFAPNDFYDQLAHTSQITAQIRKVDYGAGIQINHSRAPFNNVLARQSVQAAVDVNQIMTAGYGKNLWKASGVIFGESSPNASQAGLDQYNQKNLNKAKQLFQQLVTSGGYNNQPVVILCDSTDTQDLNVGQALQATLQTIGYKVDLQSLDTTTATANLFSKDKWDLYPTSGPMGPGQDDPVNAEILNPAYAGWYSNSMMEDLRQQFSQAVTDQDRKTIVDKVQLLWYQDVPWIQLGRVQFYDAYRSYVKGFVGSPVPEYFWNVWLDK